MDKLFGCGLVLIFWEMAMERNALRNRVEAEREIGDAGVAFGGD